MTRLTPSFLALYAPPRKGLFDALLAWIKVCLDRCNYHTNKRDGGCI
jgi:hypothetical protein